MAPKKRVLTFQVKGKLATTRNGSTRAPAGASWVGGFYDRQSGSRRLIRTSLLTVPSSNPSDAPTQRTSVVRASASPGGIPSAKSAPFRRELQQMITTATRRRLPRMVPFHWGAGTLSCSRKLPASQILVAKTERLCPSNRRQLEGYSHNNSSIVVAPSKQEIT